MSAPPKSLVKSRENLQAISNNPHIIIKYEIFDRVISDIWHNIRIMSRKTSHIINLLDSRHYSGGFVLTETIRLELIEILKREYPGVDFTYKETSGYDGKILEKIIIMDWS